MNRGRSVILVGALVVFLAVVAAYTSHQYQRAKMKTTITHMKNLGNALDALQTYVGTCDEAAKATRAPLQCRDAWGDPIALRQSTSDPRSYVIWCQGTSPATAQFVYQPHRFIRLPKDAPP